MRCSAGLPTASGAPRPDLIFKRRDTQQPFEDNQYFNNVSAAPRHNHSIASPGTWTYALVVQNDGDVTAYAAGAGVVIPDVAPGESFVVGFRFSLAAGVHDSGVLASVKLSSASAPELVDFARLWVDAPTQN